MHVLGIRSGIVERHPWLPGAIMKAFAAAKAMAQTALFDTSATKVTMPFVEDTLAAARRLLGPDPWTYGVPGNEHVLDTFLAMHHKQGLSKRRLSVEELFHPSVYESYSL